MGKGMALVTDTHTKTESPLGPAELSPAGSPGNALLRPARNPFRQTKLKHGFGTDLYGRRVRGERARGSAGACPRCRACAGMMKQVARESTYRSARGSADARPLCRPHTLRRPVDPFGRAGDVQEFAMRS